MISVIKFLKINVLSEYKTLIINFHKIRYKIKTFSKNNENKIQYTAKNTVVAAKFHINNFFGGFTCGFFKVKKHSIEKFISVY